MVSKRSLIYQWQTINTMYNRAKQHPRKTKGIEAAQAVFEAWLKETYPQKKREQRAFKPLLSKKTVEALLPLLLERAGEDGIDTNFAEMYVNLGPRKRLANTLVDDGEPEGPDWDRARTDALSGLVAEGEEEGATDVDEKADQDEDGNGDGDRDGDRDGNGNGNGNGNGDGGKKLWGEDGRPSRDHLSLIAWAWSPVSESKLLKTIRE